MYQANSLKFNSDREFQQHSRANSA